jgi:hypothetical protein
MADAMYYEVGEPAGDVDAARPDAMYYEVEGEGAASLLADPAAVFASLLD